MNIFYTDHDPVLAAQSLPDKHVVKMPVESVQMLVSAAIRHGLPHNVRTVAGALHKGGYHNHPSTVWAGDSQDNFTWLWQHGKALCDEYTTRYGKEHACSKQLDALFDCLEWMPKGTLTSPALAMPDECKTKDPVESYRNCIRLKVQMKPDSFVWKRGRTAPSWL
jgi:hypothetical protein